MTEGIVYVSSLKSTLLTCKGVKGIPLKKTKKTGRNKINWVLVGHESKIIPGCGHFCKTELTISIRSLTPSNLDSMNEKFS